MNEPARLSTTASQACPSLPIDHGYSLFSTRNSEPVTVSGWRPTSDASGCRRPRNYFLHQAFSEALTPLYVKTRVLSGLDDGLACAEVCHDALVDLSRKEAFQASDDLAFGPAIGGASGDVVAGWLVESHADDDGSIEGGVGVSVAASRPGSGGGHRHATAALYRTVIVRMRFHQPTRDDVARRTADGRTKREIIRCLKRFLAREIYQRVMTDFRARQEIIQACRTA